MATWLRVQSFTLLFFLFFSFWKPFSSLTAAVLMLFFAAFATRFSVGKGYGKGFGAPKEAKGLVRAVVSAQVVPGGKWNNDDNTCLDQEHAESHFKVNHRSEFRLRTTMFKTKCRVVVSRLFVGGLPPDTTNLEMYQIFSAFGPIAPRGATWRRRRI